MNTTGIGQRWMPLGIAPCGALVLTMSLVVAAAASSAYAITVSPSLTIGCITGTVTDPDGQPPPAGTHIKLRQPDGTLAGQAAVAPDTGAFTLGPAPNGRHVLRAVSADATIVGDLVVQSGDSVIAASGWASAQINGAPVGNGTSNIPVPSGKARRLRRTFGQFPLPGLWRSN